MTALTRSDLEYLERLGRREIRRKETDLRGFRQRDGQSVEDAFRVRARLADAVEYRRGVLFRLQATWGRPSRVKAGAA